MAHYVGLDVSLEETSICVVDDSKPLRFFRRIFCLSQATMSWVYSD